MFEIGRVCVKIAGRDAGQTCVVVEKIDERYVVVDGQTRRRKVNIAHLEPTETTVNISEKALAEDIVKALDVIGIKITPRSQKQEKK